MAGVGVRGVRPDSTTDSHGEGDHVPRTLPVSPAIPARPRGGDAPAEPPAGRKQGSMDHVRDCPGDDNAGRGEVLRRTRPRETVHTLLRRHQRTRLRDPNYPSVLASFSGTMRPRDTICKELRVRIHEGDHEASRHAGALPPIRELPLLRGTMLPSDAHRWSTGGPTPLQHGPSTPDNPPRIRGGAPGRVRPIRDGLLRGAEPRHTGRRPER